VRRDRLEPHTLAGAYAVDALTAADRAGFERHAARCEQCASEIAELRAAAATLAAATARQPPAGLTERALAIAARTRQLPPATAEESAPSQARKPVRLAPASTFRHAPMRRLAAVRAAIAFAALIAVTALTASVAANIAAHQPGQRQPGGVMTSVLTAPDATMMSARIATGGTATIVMSERYRALVFAATGLPALPRTRSYELWLMGPGGDRPAGMLPTPHRGMTGPVTATGLTAGDHLGLAIEPAGGATRPGTALILVVAL
jgi:anti-sigma-K factor RskA